MRSRDVMGNIGEMPRQRDVNGYATICQERALPSPRRLGDKKETAPNGLRNLRNRSNERFQQGVGQPEGGARALLRVVQVLQAARFDQGSSGDEGGID